ncbi:MAG TPA: hypothetical protein DCE03_02985 [Synergistaceae bacterium]|nr:MAG: ErfK/YbiS/YcfS/YnhG family protein [Synergistales bacterium 53_16]MDK2845859.1 hypothetical protein [Synergistales bacterium]MDN5336515.1 hypothetical protein [Synergistales bacterium]HAA47439.1 hypothetical protein [Synergistaceae bacterium]HAG21939.1 hypothetical protein [Synergistaceae bacterium]
MRPKRPMAFALLLLFCFMVFLATGDIAFASKKFPAEIPRPFVLEEFVANWELEGSIWILIDKPSFSLTQYRGTQKISSYPVALGKNPENKQRAGDMRTPEGVFKVKSIHDSKHWVHDFGDGKGPIPGAYGPWFIRLETGWKGIGIHGTHDPASIGTLATEGCIRMKNEDLLRIVDETPVGTVVVITP